VNRVSSAPPPENFRLDVTPSGQPGLSPDVIGTAERAKRQANADFDVFVTQNRPQLLRVLNAHYGTELGPEATADALAYAWQHWDRIRVMDNPVGYLYRVGQSALRKHTRWRRRVPILPEVNIDTMPHVEPGLPAALALLTRPQRTAVLLVHAHGWTLADAAASMDVSVSTLRNHLQRGLDNLRQKLEVTDHG
jgi:DNA-directed RNA polymerase specialized sigma24 family protein